jgi:dTDP-4-dehydrorhamnose reductase
MKLFLAGASGLVGAHVAAAAARRGFEVTAVAWRFGGEIPGAARRLALDLSNEHAAQRAVLDLFPDAIVNAAAVSEVSACEAQPELSRKLNVALPATLAMLARHLGARFIHLSSEQVFDGTRAPYRPGDPVAPLSLYGRQKAEAEREVARLAPEEAVTLRLPLLGGNSLGGTRSLHERLFAAWAAGQRARLYRDEIRQPCSAENVAEAVVELCERRDFHGLFHWAGAEPISRAQMGRRIAAHFRLPADRLVDEASRLDDPLGSARQPDLSLECAPLAGALKTRPERFADLLERLVVPPPCRAWYLHTAPPPEPLIA